MDNQKLAKEIVKQLGGKANIVDVTHCMTRLRFHLADDEQVNEGKLTALDGVAGVMNKAGQYQVVIGTEVAAVYKELPLGDKKRVSPAVNAPEEKKGVISVFFDTITSIFTPILPAIIGAGMLKAFLSLFVALNIIDATGQTYVILNNLGDTVFYFISIFVGYSSAQRFGANPFIGAAIGAFLVNPTIVSLLAEGTPVSLLGIHVIPGTYSASVIPPILASLLLSYVEKFLNKVTPKILKIFVVPTLSLFIVGTVTLLGIGPIGTILGNGMASAFEYLNAVTPWMLPMLFGGLSPILIMTGMHHAILPIALPIFLANGYETFVTPGMFVSSTALAASAFAVTLKTRSSKLKQTSISTGITALMGITEPVMYGLSIPLKTPLISALIGGAAGGIFAGIMKVYAYGIGGGLTSLPIYIGGEGMNNFVFMLVSLAIAAAVSFVVMLLLGFKDPQTQESTELTADDEEIKNPIKGKVIPLNEITDDAFSLGVMGSGVGIIPEEGRVYSPVKGVVNAIFPTKHAVGITSEAGTELLIHIGVNTVKLGGEYFESVVQQGDSVEAGTLLIKFDKEKIREAGYDITTAFIVTNPEYEVTEQREGMVNENEKLFEVRRGANEN